MISETRIDCERCKSNACFEIIHKQGKIWQCMGCGFTSNTLITKKNLTEYKEVLPELYKDLEFKDKNGHYWYPNTVILSNNSMVFAEGRSIEDWKWSAVKSKQNKPDMTTKKEFVEKDFMEALSYIGYFEASQKE